MTRLGGSDCGSAVQTKMSTQGSRSPYLLQIVRYVGVRKLSLTVTSSFLALQLGLLKFPKNFGNVYNANYEY